MRSINKKDEEEKNGKSLLPLALVSIGASATADDIFFDQERYAPEELAEGKRLLREEGIRAELTPIQIVRLMRKLKYQSGQGAAPPPPGTAAGAAPLDGEKAKMRKVVNRLVNALIKRTGLEYAQVHKLLVMVTGTTMRDRTLLQLQQAHTCLEAWLTLAKEEEAPNGYEGWLSVAQRGDDRTA